MAGPHTGDDRRSVYPMATQMAAHFIRGAPSVSFQCYLKAKLEPEACTHKLGLPLSGGTQTRDLTSGIADMTKRSASVRF